MIENEEKKIESALIVGVVHRDQPLLQVNDFLDELELLAETAGAEVKERLIQRRDRIDPAFMLGRGKIEELAQMVKYNNADVIIFDDDLSPAQVKNIQEVCKIKIIDRSALILDIFAKHARTRESRTQVELAQLNYLLPRLTRQWTHLSRQVGGIGVRGPGETQLEIDRRLVRKRISVLEQELIKITSQRDTRRKRRRDTFKIALVGYTNVGKSTLLNTLTDSDILVQDQLFATLDPTVRSLQLNLYQVLLIDTVGFIRKLPHHLVASFKSTLEETKYADMLMHVVDISNHNWKEQMHTVMGVLGEMQADKKPVLTVFNKIDLVKDVGLMKSIRNSYPDSLFISAKRGINLPELCNTLEDFISHSFQRMDFSIPVQRSDIVAQLHNLGKVLSLDYSGNDAHISLLTSKDKVGRIQRLVNFDKNRDR